MESKKITKIFISELEELIRKLKSGELLIEDTRDREVIVS